MLTFSFSFALFVLITQNLTPAQSDKIEKGISVGGEPVEENGPASMGLSSERMKTKGAQQDVAKASRPTADSLPFGAPREDCHLEKMKVDAVFLVDGSFSIEPDDFNKSLRFISSFVDFLISQGIDIEDGSARIGAIEYSNDARVVVPLGSETEPIFLKSEIEGIKKSDGGTFTGKGLQVMRNQFEDNAREGALRIGFVLTDGESDDGGHVKEEASKLLSSGVIMYGIGVGAASLDELLIIAGGVVPTTEAMTGNGAISIQLSPVESKSSTDEMKIASGNATDRVFTVGNYDDLQSIAEQMRRKVCVALTESWAEILAKPEVFLSLGAIIAIIVLSLVVAVVVWRLGVLARRRFVLAQLENAKGELRRSQSEINKIYKSPTTTVVMGDIVKNVM